MRGLQLRDFLYVEDVAASFVALLESEAKSVVKFVSGVAITLKDMMYAILQQLALQDLVRYGQFLAA
jgi:nucleoside-diphosphate-sugar epimerase